MLVMSSLLGEVVRRGTIGTYPDDPSSDQVINHHKYSLRDAKQEQSVSQRIFKYYVLMQRIMQRSP